MTREFAFPSNNVGNYTEDDMVDLRDYIFDSFENQKCENCRYYAERKGGGSCSVIGFRVIKTMSCNKFEASAE